MIKGFEKLPTDTASLHNIIGLLTTEKTDLQTENKFLKEQLGILRAKKFGKSSEKVDRQIELLELQVEESEHLGIIATEPEQDNEVPKKQKPKRQKPEHLERIEVVLNHAPICPSCGGEEFRKIADDISETLEYIPSSFKVKR